MSTKKVAYEDRCPTRFERRTPGKRYVNNRWHCPRKKLKGLPYCSYCEPSDKKRERLARLATDGEPPASQEKGNG